MMSPFSLLALASLLFAERGLGLSTKPNIVVIMSDDQDYQLGSLEAQPVVRRELMAKGLTMDNHFTTIAQCCPSRTCFLRGQAGHNTNMTHIAPPGGAYDKFLISGEDHDYLPFWLNKAGYQTAYIGKFMNGYTMDKYNQTPKGWDYTNVLLNPYTYEFNNVVLSENGKRPIFYNGYHQLDVVRANALDQMQKLIAAHKPYYIQIAPASPHQSNDGPTVPPIRHMWSFNNATAPRRPNFNPSDDLQMQKPSYVKTLPLLNESQVDYVDWSHRSRLQALKGVDELVEDVLNLLESSGTLDNTFVIYTTDNGYHEGNHRIIGGKGLPYIEDTNIPLIVRGPGVPQGVISKSPSTHIDMAPTFLDIAGVNVADFPAFFDGRSLLPEWMTGYDNSTSMWNGSYVAKEILNIEFWGSIDNGAAPDYSHREANNSYKSVRLVGERSAWLFSRWCTNNDTELYNTIEDPYELTNLAINPDAETQRRIQRFNGILLVTKSCSQGTCRDPWQLLAINAGGDFSTLDEAMHPKYDSFFAGLPSVGFQICMDYQYIPNEIPFYPEGATSLGRQWRLTTDNFVTHAANASSTPGNNGRMGTTAQRYADFTTILESARNVTDKEIGTVVACYGPDYCNGFGGGD